MRPLTNNDIESEISYAYLHAVASHAGAGCQVSNRASDGNGIDAIITGWGPFDGGGFIEEVDIKIQLKATKQEPATTSTHISYWVDGINRYNDLRSETVSNHRILVVMFLPQQTNDWLTISESELLLKKCAYWVSLRGAGPSTNSSGETIYLPKIQVFNSLNLMGIFAKLSRKEVINYQSP